MWRIKERKELNLKGNKIKNGLKVSQHLELDLIRVSFVCVCVCVCDGGDAVEGDRGDAVQ